MHRFIRKLANALAIGVIGLFSFSASANSTDGELLTRMKRLEFDSTHYRSFMRGTVLAAGGGSASNSKNNSDLDVGYLAGGLIDIGRSTFSFETGVMYAALPALLKFQSTESTALNSGVRMRLGYVGVPAIVKYNYIEKPQASFSLKAGVLQAWLTATEGSSEWTTTDPLTEETSTISTKDRIGETDTLALAGFTGSAPLGESVAFVIDGTYLQGLTDVTAAGSQNRAFFLGLGVRFDL
jgi:hypothetical protein